MGGQSYSTYGSMSGAQGVDYAAGGPTSTSNSMTYSTGPSYTHSRSFTAAPTQFQAIDLHSDHVAPVVTTGKFSLVAPTRVETIHIAAPAPKVTTTQHTTTQKLVRTVPIVTRSFIKKPKTTVETFTEKHDVEYTEPKRYVQPVRAKKVYIPPPPPPVVDYVEVPEETLMHKVKIEQEVMAAPALHAAREVPAAVSCWKRLSWCWLIPLLLLLCCCLLPLLWLCCRKKKAKKKPEQVIMPIKRKTFNEARAAPPKPRAVVKEQIVIPEKKFVLEKKMKPVDEREIEREIEEELARMRKPSPTRRRVSTLVKNVGTKEEILDQEGRIIETIIHDSESQTVRREVPVQEQRVSIRQTSARIEQDALLRAEAETKVMRQREERERMSQKRDY